MSVLERTLNIRSMYSECSNPVDRTRVYCDNVDTLAVLEKAPFKPWLGLHVK